MGQDDPVDDLKNLRELIAGEKAEAYQRFHGDDFPEKWSRRHAGKSFRRFRLKPLRVILAGVIPFLLVVLLGRWLCLEEKGKSIESLHGNILLQTHLPENIAFLRLPARGLEPFKKSLEKILRDGYRRKSFPDIAASSVETALQACIAIGNWGGLPRNHGLASPMPSPEMIQKDMIRSRLFAEIMTKWKEV